MDEDRAGLSTKILDGKFGIPDWMSEELKDLIHLMLSVETHKRIRLGDIM